MDILLLGKVYFPENAEKHKIFKNQFDLNFVGEINRKTCKEFMVLCFLFNLVYDSYLHIKWKK